MFAQKALLTLLAVALLSSLTLAQQACGDGFCQAGETYCEQDCAIDDTSSFDSGLGDSEGFAPQPQSKGISPTVSAGATLVVLLVVAGFAVNSSGKPTQYWKARHAKKHKK